MKIVQLLRGIERAAIVAIFLLMVFLFFMNVLVREFAGSLASDFAWVEEAVRLLNLFLVFGALGLALEGGRHVSVDSLRNALDEKKRRQLLRLIDLIGLTFSLYVALLAYRLVLFVFSTGQRSPTLNIEMGWIYMAPMIGFLLLALRYGLSFFGVLNRFAPLPEDENMDPREGERP